MTDPSAPPAAFTEADAEAIAAASEAAIAFRRSLPDRPARPEVDLDTAMARFRTPLADDGQAAAQVIAGIVAGAEGALHAMAAPSFFGYVLGASMPVGVAADTLVSAWGQNAASSGETPAVAGMERAVCDWVIDLLGLPAGSGAGIVTGATVANFTGILAARNALLAARGWDVEARGLIGAPDLPVLIGADAHSAPFGALRYAGLGAATARRVGTDGEGRIRAAALAEALDACAAPPLVILQAGQINTGAFDPFDELVPMVHARGGWAHVDGAFGLWLAAVPELAPRLRGVELADSWAIDLHKGLNAPFDAGMVITRDRAPLVAAMSARGTYLAEQSDHWDPSDSTPELSRRARGVPSYAILRHLGRDGLREMISRHCRLAERLAARLAAEPGIAVLNEIHCNQVALACGPAGPTGDALTDRVLAEVKARGRVYPTHGEWRGRRIIRASVIGYAMQEAHVDLLAEEIAGAWRAIRPRTA